MIEFLEKIRWSNLFWNAKLRIDDIGQADIGQASIGG